MGWKSTICITRQEALDAIRKCLDTYEDKTNEELEELMYGLNIGDDLDKPYFGYNLHVVDTNDEVKEWEK